MVYLSEQLIIFLRSEDTSDTVPIVVGSVLAAMILLVMVSYFVIRRRAIKK